MSNSLNKDDCSGKVKDLITNTETEANKFEKKLERMIIAYQEENKILREKKDNLP